MVTTFSVLFRHVSFMLDFWQVKRFHTDKRIRLWTITKIKLKLEQVLLPPLDTLENKLPFGYQILRYGVQQLTGTNYFAEAFKWNEHTILFNLHCCNKRILLLKVGIKEKQNKSKKVILSIGFILSGSIWRIYSKNQSSKWRLSWTSFSKLSHVYQETSFGITIWEI